MTIQLKRPWSGVLVVTIASATSVIALGILATMVVADHEPDPPAGFPSHVDRLAIDTDSNGNTANGPIGPIDLCRSVSLASSVTLDIIADEIPARTAGGGGITGFQYDLQFDSSKVAINSQNSQQKLAASGAVVAFDAGSDSVFPDTDGSYVSSRGDLSATIEQGPGVLERLTVQAVGGVGTVTTLTLTDISFDGDGVPNLFDDSNDGNADTYPIHNVINATLAIGIPCPPTDYDNDGVRDAAEPGCGADAISAAVRPERLDGPYAGVSDDGDASIDEALPAGSQTLDCDGDGFTGTTEQSVFGDGDTSVDQACISAWPADLVTSQTINISDVLALKPVFNQTVPPVSPRFDIVPSGAINISDVLALKPVFNKSCFP